MFSINNIIPLLYFTLIGLFLVSPFIYSVIRVIESFRKKEIKKTNKMKKFGFLFVTMIFSYVILGFSLNGFGVKGGLPLHIYAVGNEASNAYASLSNTHLPTLMIFFLLGIIAYGMIDLRLNKLSPIIYTLCSTLLIINILFAIIYITHTGFSHYSDVIDIYLSIFFLQLGYVSVSLLYIGKLKESLDDFNDKLGKEEIDYPNKMLLFLYRISLKYQRLPIASILVLFPVLVIIQLILVLFGQRPDSFIRVFLDTSSFNYSIIPTPPPKIIPGDSHYLCTVSIKGHKKLVKPLRSGIRGGSRIVVNRQLLIANAFENILEEYTPHFHQKIRAFYDQYGYPISKHINTKWSADMVYLIMKPLEWFFLLVIYTIVKKPENLIHVQYSELRKK